MLKSNIRRNVIWTKDDVLEEDDGDETYTLVTYEIDVEIERCIAIAWDVFWKTQIYHEKFRINMKGELGYNV